MTTPVADARPPELRAQNPLPPSAPAIPASTRPRHRWTADDYFRMSELGVLHHDDRVELIEGDLIEMAPSGPEHAGWVDQLNELLTYRLHGIATVRVQSPVILSERNAPEPDLTVLRRRDDYYKTAHPRAADVLLLIEVVDSTAADDRRVKAPLYARYGIPDYWLIDLPAQRLEIYREPVDGHYRQVTEHRTGLVSPAALPAVVINVAELFPAPPKSPAAGSAP